MSAPGTFSPGEILSAADLNAIGTWTSYTPVLVQSGTRSATVDYAEYCQINKFCVANVSLTCTTTGASGNIITVSLPVNATSDSAIKVFGSGMIFDTSGSDVRLLTVIRGGATVVRFLTEATTDNISGLGANPSFTLGNGDVIQFSIAYETA
jgi:hypothetical protein